MEIWRDSSSYNNGAKGFLCKQYFYRQKLDRKAWNLANPFRINCDFAVLHFYCDQISRLIAYFELKLAIVFWQRLSLADIFSWVELLNAMAEVHTKYVSKHFVWNFGNTANTYWYKINNVYELISRLQTKIDKGREPIPRMGSVTSFYKCPN